MKAQDAKAIATEEGIMKASGLRCMNAERLTKAKECSINIG